jgi:CBS domain-containing protein
MTGEVLTTSSATTVRECMTLMTDKRIRHLPVVDDDRLIGMISIGDLVQAIISEQQEEISQLEQYISG